MSTHSLDARIAHRLNGVQRLARNLRYLLFEERTKWAGRSAIASLSISGKRLFAFTAKQVQVPQHHPPRKVV
jgi:hypothetical protein